MNEKDGGPAFSQLQLAGPTGPTMSSGMTLRDYFAAAVMPTCLVRGQQAGVHSFERCANAAYEIADAMLKERAK